MHHFASTLQRDALPKEATWQWTPPLVSLQCNLKFSLTWIKLPDTSKGVQTCEQLFPSLQKRILLPRTDCCPLDHHPCAVTNAPNRWGDREIIRWDLPRQLQQADISSCCVPKRKTPNLVPACPGKFLRKNRVTLTHFEKQPEASSFMRLLLIACF